MGRADFLVAPCNRDAVAWLDRWPDWPGPALVIHGPEGCGKTHLTHVWRAASGAVTLNRAAPSALPDGAKACTLDDADAAVDERDLLHLYNVVAERGGHILLTARSGPAHWRLDLPDLASRLRAAPSVALGAPDDALIGAVLVKLFADRQLRVEPAVVTYLVMRIERSFAALREIVAALDASALIGKRNITVPLARGVLAEISGRVDGWISD